ncbi:hypothetical protein SLE2022_023730 [Rubroshorea leprosula]
MDVFSQYFVSSPMSVSPPMSLSPMSDSSGSRPVNYSDEEVMLASSHPKRRAGRKKFRETRHPVYRGVRRRNSRKWVCEVREPKKKSRIWLGTFPTAEMAARAHDVAVLALRGRSACLNFADSYWRLPVPASSDPKEIQKTAAEAAEAFRPVEGNSGDEMKPTENVESGTSGVSEDLFYTEEEIFGMPGLIAEMAKAMMLPPPDCIYNADEVELDNIDVSLWSY